MTYESAIERLTQIVEKLSSESASLNESMSLFEEGVKLIKFCNQALSAAKGKMMEIKEELGKLKMEETE